MFEDGLGKGCWWLRQGEGSGATANGHREGDVVVAECVSEISAGTALRLLVRVQRARIPDDEMGDSAPMADPLPGPLVPSEVAAGEPALARLQVAQVGRPRVVVDDSKWIVVAMEVVGANPVDNFQGLVGVEESSAGPQEPDRVSDTGRYVRSRVGPLASVPSMATARTLPCTTRVESGVHGDDQLVGSSDGKAESEDHRIGFP